MVILLFFFFLVFLSFLSCLLIPLFCVCSVFSFLPNVHFPLHFFFVLLSSPMLCKVFKRCSDHSFGNDLCFFSFSCFPFGMRPYTSCCCCCLKKQTRLPLIKVRQRLIVKQQHLSFCHKQTFHSSLALFHPIKLLCITKDIAAFFINFLLVKEII